MLDDEFNKQRASLVRDLASRADPFIKRRLLSRYEKGPPKTKPLPILSLNDQHTSDRSDSSDAG
ncbi:hypothetical protein [Bradyrhizobium elkanii]|uniref:hypothetical protein n=1 Tax=Bradyrhizobium elkanii TaxID=29448 RepID=UPI00138B1776|nr:hypothetical protein [Bradyrhizobium elkanii]